VYEGNRREAALRSRHGTISIASIPVYDLVRDTNYTATETEPLVIPEESYRRSRLARRLSSLRSKMGSLAAGCRHVKYRDAQRRNARELEISCGSASLCQTFSKKLQCPRIIGLPQPKHGLLAHRRIPVVLRHSINLARPHPWQLLSAKTAFFFTSDVRIVLDPLL